MNLTINDIRVGDIYEHELGGFYVVAEMFRNNFRGNRVNSTYAKAETHTIDEIVNFYGKFR